jgi:cysteine synthase A
VFTRFRNWCGFIPEILNTSIYDEIITITGGEAKKFTRLIARKEDCAGISAGANGLAAARIAERLGPSKQVLTVFCDTGERYLSTGVFNR